MNALTRGVLAGTLATGPMTYAFFEIFKYLPKDEKSPLPPSTITEDFLEFLGISDELHPEVKSLITMANHFGYGAAVAIPYSAFFSKNKTPLLIKGSLYGLAVWGGSYLGLLPSLHFRSNAPDMPASRNAMMIASHIVWGLALAYADEALRERGNEMLYGARKAPDAE